MNYTLRYKRLVFVLCIFMFSLFIIVPFIKPDSVFFHYPCGDHCNIYINKVKPEIKIEKWDSYFKMSREEKTYTPFINNDKFVFDGIDESVLIYFLKNDALEYEIILKKKPETNTVNLSVETKNLTLRLIKIEDIIQKRTTELLLSDQNISNITTTFNNDLLGSIVVESKNKNSEFIIFRPKIYDADNKSVYGEYRLQNNTLLIVIPQEFLDNATYPIRIDPAISYGNEYLFDSSTSQYISVSSLDSTHFVIAYADSYAYGTAIIGTVSDTTISYGSKYTFNTPQTYQISVSSLDSTHFVVTYQDWGNNEYGTAKIGTVSGTTISYGSEYVCSSNTIREVSVSSLDSTHFVVAYGGGVSTGKARIGVVNGSNISYGNEYEFTGGGSIGSLSVSSLDSTHFVVAYGGDSTGGINAPGWAVIGTVSGTTISYGSEYQFNPSPTSWVSVSSLDSTHFVVAYEDNANNNYGTARIGTVSGSTISWSDEKVFFLTTTNTWYTRVSSLDSTHFVVAYSRGGAGNGGSKIGTKEVYFSIILNSPPNQTITNDNTPNFNFTVFGTENTYNCTLYIDNINYGNDNSVANNTATIITPTSAVPDGIHNWYIDCNAEGVSNQSETREITIDTSIPNVTLIEPTQNNTITNNSWMYWNASISNDTTTCVLETNIGNFSMNMSNGYCYYNLTNSTSPLYVCGKILVSDLANNTNQTEQICWWLNSYFGNITATTPDGDQDWEYSQIAGETESFNLSFTTTGNINSSVNFTLSGDLANSSRFTVVFDPEIVIVVPSETSKTTVNITSNISLPSGTYTGEIIWHSQNTTETGIINVTIYISSASGDVNIVNTTFSISMYKDTTTQRHFYIENNGNYNLTNCNMSFSSIISTTVNWSMNSFTIPVGQSVTVTMNLTANEIGADDSAKVSVSCIATVEGGTDSDTITGTLFVTQYQAPTPTEAGGGGYYPTVPSFTVTPSENVIDIPKWGECKTIIINLTWEAPSVNARVTVKGDIVNLVKFPKTGDYILLEEGKVTQIPVKICLPETTEQNVVIAEKTWKGSIEFLIQLPTTTVTKEIELEVRKVIYKPTPTLPPGIPTNILVAIAIAVTVGMIVVLFIP